MANEDIPNLTTAQRLAEARNALFLILVRQNALTSTNADGGGFSRNIGELRLMIQQLEEQLFQESYGCLQWDIRKTLDI